MAEFARSFAIELDKWYDDFEAVDLLKFKQKIAIQALIGVTLKMPVLTGRARGNTLVSVDKEDSSFDEDEFDKTGSKTISEGTAAILADHNPWAVIFVQNNLPYINRLENGHSQKQAPNGMFALTVAEIETQSL